MTDMKKLLTIVTESGEKARIDEGVNVSINVSGDSPCDVGEVLAKVTNLSSPRPVTPDMMPAPSAPPPMPMMKAIDIVGKADEPTGPGTPPAPPGDMAPHTAPEAIGQSVMMPDPSEGPSNGPSTSSQVAPPAGGVSMGGSEDELESLISQAEEELGLGEVEMEGAGSVVANVRDTIKDIYNGASRGEDMTDNIADELGDYFDAVQNSADVYLKKAYIMMRDAADADPASQATAAKKALDLLGDDDLDVNSDADNARQDYYDLKGWDKNSMEEGQMDLNSILKKHSLAFASWKRGGDIQDDPEFFQDLFDYYSDEMPYGVQKGRDGDPAYWIDNQLSQEIGGQDESMLDPAMGSAHGEGKALTMNSSYKDIHDRLREIDRALAKKNEEFANQPNPKMSDTNYMTKDLAGGLNKPKSMHKHSYKQGDNPMAMETIVREEWQKFKDSK